MVLLFLFFVVLALATPCVAAEKREVSNDRSMRANGAATVPGVIPAAHKAGQPVLCEPGTDPSADGLFYLPGTQQRCIPGPIAQKALQMY
ncbi:hypothetical protein FJU08_00090 [Martelella alba]|uniref:Porin n=1 Tax=Martelella alba TaxID=2590451 RepID=A0A506UI69_9HYPH|nr:hypothetical protein [Martelella alba]TPW33006.1 hypothetical protein FJU08_00090 [Martelella alba]